MQELLETDPLAATALSAIRNGHVEALQQLLVQNPALSRTRINRAPTGTQPAFAYELIVATTDWPGNFPRVAETIAALVAAGADVHARCGGPHGETALHFAASCDDIAALDALLDCPAGEATAEVHAEVPSAGAGAGAGCSVAYSPSAPKLSGR